MAPGKVLASLCLVFLSLALLRFDAIADELLKHEIVSENASASKAIDAISELRIAVGAERIVDEAEELRAELHEARLVFEQETNPVIGQAQGEAEHRLVNSPKRVLVVGASSIQFALGVSLESTFSGYEGVTVKRFGKLATGLSRPDFMNWPKKFAELMEEFRPDLVIANFGGNGAQDVVVPKQRRAQWGTPAWDTAYAARLKLLTDAADEGGAHMIFVGMPKMRSPKFTKKMKKLNQVMRDAVEASGHTFFSTWKLSSDAKGNYRKTVTHKGKRRLMRTSDGIHYSTLGARFVVDALQDWIESEYYFNEKGAPVLVSRHAVFSKLFDQEFFYTAFVPNPLRSAAASPGEGVHAERRTFPLFVVFPREGEGEQGLAVRGREHFKALSEKKQMVVAVLGRPNGSWYLEPKDGPSLVRSFQDEVVPDMKRHLPVQEPIHLGGIGPGGHGALYLAAKFDDFASGVGVAAPKKLQELVHTEPALRKLLGDPTKERARWREANLRRILRRQSDASLQWVPVDAVEGLTPPNTQSK